MQPGTTDRLFGSTTSHNSKKLEKEGIPPTPKLKLNGRGEKDLLVQVDKHNQDGGHHRTQ